MRIREHMIYFEHSRFSLREDARFCACSMKPPLYASQKGHQSFCRHTLYAAAATATAAGLFTLALCRMTLSCRRDAPRPAHTCRDITVPTFLPPFCVLFGNKLISVNGLMTCLIFNTTIHVTDIYLLLCLLDLFMPLCWYLDDHSTDDFLMPRSLIYYISQTYITSLCYDFIYYWFHL